jgi:hypothetical protein
MRYPMTRITIATEIPITTHMNLCMLIPPLAQCPLQGIVGRLHYAVVLWRRETIQ